MYAHEHVASPVGAGTREQLAASRGEMESAFRAYRLLPAFPDEAEHIAAIARDIALVEEALRAAMEAADQGSPSAAERMLGGEFHRHVERADGSVQTLLLLNTRQTREMAARIAEARRRSASLGGVLGGLSVGAALLASGLALRALRRQHRLLNEHADVLAARATELEAFAGRVAHDLKNPLGALALKLVSVQRRADTSPKMREASDLMARQVDCMVRIIEGLLEFARAGAAPSPGARADVGEILDEVIAEVRPDADELDTALEVNAFPPTTVGCTPAALTSVLSNLLRNAVKYIVDGEQPPRRIAVHVRDLGGAVLVEVEDNGPGLPPGTEELVFEPFRRVSAGRQPGVGLGLATVKKLVEAYRGTVGVRSKPGDGSVFWFQLPTVAPAVQEGQRGAGTLA